MRIISRGTLRDFWKEYKDSQEPLKAWFHTAKNADWATPQDIKNDYRNVSFLKENRICFNIAGNKYRLVVKANYDYRILYIRFIGTHKTYDEIDANNI